MNIKAGMTALTMGPLLKNKNQKQKQTIEQKKFSVSDMIIKAEMTALTMGPLIHKCTS